MRTETKTLAQAMRILAATIESDDGVANAAIFEAAERLEDLQQERDRLEVRQLLYILGSATEIVIRYHDESIAAEDAMNDLWQVLKKTPDQHLAEIKAQAIDEFIARFASSFPTFVTKRAFHDPIGQMKEVANTIRSEAKK